MLKTVYWYLPHTLAHHIAQKEVPVNFPLLRELGKAYPTVSFTVSSYFTDDRNHRNFGPDQLTCYSPVLSGEYPLIHR